MPTLITDVDQSLRDAVRRFALHELAEYTLDFESIEYGTVHTAPLSTSLIRDTKTINNCSDLPQTYSESLNLTVTTGVEVSVTEGISSTRRQSFTLNISAAQNLGMQVSMREDLTVNASRPERQSKNTTVTRGETFTRTIPPRTQFTAEMVMQRRLDKIDFVATAVVTGKVRRVDVRWDQVCTGPIVADVCLGTWIKVPVPVSSMVPLESILTDAERRFQVKGTLNSVTAHDVKIVFKSSEIKDISSVQCTEPPSLKPEHLKALHQSPAVSSSLVQATEPPTLGLPHGISYSIVGIREVTRMTPACGFNDLGLPNPGKFQIEDRHYTEYDKGKGVRTWTETHETFLSCTPV